MVYGLYDIVDRVERDSVSRIKRITTKRIRAIKKVTTTTEMMVAKA